MNMIILSLTTIPNRKEALVFNLPYILNQTLKFDKLVINLDNNLSKEDYEFYYDLIKQDNRIEINTECDAKWRSCNKLLPTLKKYPNDIIITLDDDISYFDTACEELYNEWEANKECIITHEVNPVYYEEGMLKYYNEFGLKLKQKDFSKYLSNICLFPPHTFDDTQVFDYDLMMKMTNGTHDELWFWENTFLKGIKCICLDSTISFSVDSKYQHKKDDYQLTTINEKQEQIDEYNKKFNDEFKEQIDKVLKEQTIEFFVNDKNYISHISYLKLIKTMYEGFQIVFNLYPSLKNSKIDFIIERLNKLNLISKVKIIKYNVYEDLLTLYKHPFTLTRLGRNSDGGYVVPEELIDNKLISCGISREVSFEEDYIKHNNEVKIYAYDNTINNFPIDNHKNVIWEKLNINDKEDLTNISLNTIFEKYDLTKNNNVFLKMDIEGAEYVAFKNFKYLNNVAVMVVEIHDIKKRIDDFVNLLTYFNNNMVLIHKHDNNHNFYFDFMERRYANVYELTYVNKRFIPKLNKNYITLPIDGLDYPNKKV